MTFVQRGSDTKMDEGGVQLAPNLSLTLNFNLDMNR